MFRLTNKEFEDAVQEALDSIPRRFMDALDNVAIAIQDEPDDWQLESADEGYGSQDEESGELLGLYDGVSLAERGDGYGEFGFEEPDIVTIFKGPHERSFDSREQIVEEVRRTVVHEIGHYFGMDEDDIERMGYQ